MAHSDDSDRPIDGKRFNRRAFLIGATTGAVATGLGAAGLHVVQQQQRKLVTPAAVEHGQAAEIARGVIFLCSEEAAFVTGSTLSINGGQHMY